VIGYNVLSENNYKKLEQDYIEKQKSQNKPIKNMLYIGSSYTSIYDVPLLVNLLLLSMKAPYEYQYSSITEANADFQYHLNNQKLQQTLDKKYDFVFVQPHPSEIITKNINETSTFYKNGKILLDKARKNSIKTALYQPWIPKMRFPLSISEQYIPFLLMYNQKMNKDYINQEFDAITRQRYYEQSNRDHAILGYQTRSDVIPVAQSWHKAKSKCPKIDLIDSDNYNATIQGAYLSALTIVRYINNNQRIPSVIFYPTEIPNHDMKCLVNVVNSNI